MSFLDLGTSSEICAALSSQGILEPTDIQKAVIPAALAGRHICAESETGTGKTLAFLVPILMGCDPAKRTSQALIISPTRELASQTHRVLENLIQAAGSRLRSCLLLGGASPTRQIDELATKPQILIATPGRALQFLEGGKLFFDNLSFLVLDEADRLFAPEACEETGKLVDKVPASAAIWLFSATLDAKTISKAAARMSDAFIVKLDTSAVLSGDIEHWVFLADSRKKVDAVRRFEQAVKPERALLFVHDSGEAFNALMRMRDSGIPVEAIHGDFDSQKRLEAVENFRSGRARWLITSDVAARGLDIEGVSHVLMLDVPREAPGYVHRAGRTGRNGKKGVCAAVVDSGELKFLSRIAVRFGFAFKTKRLHSVSVYDVTLEEFFAYADKMSRSFHAHAKRARDADA